MTKQSPWQPIETAPKDGTPVLLRRVNAKGVECFYVAWHFMGEWTTGMHTVFDPTHYMLIPQLEGMLRDRALAGRDDTLLEVLKGDQTMTEEQAIELGRRAVAAGWKWQAGAVDMAGDRVMTTSPRIREWWKDQWEIWGCPAEMFYIGLNVDQPRYGHRMGEVCTTTFMQPPDFRDAATLGILRQQVVALVPGAVESVVMRWFGATIGATVRWCAAGGGWIGPEHWAHGVGDNWPVEALVACLEAAKKGEL